MPTTESGKEIITHPALWEKAKKKAAEQGKEDRWALISHIYQQMGGGYHKSSNVSKAFETEVLKARKVGGEYLERWMGPDGKWRYRYYEKKTGSKIKPISEEHTGENTEWYNRHLPSVDEWAGIKSGNHKAMQKYVNRTIWSRDYVSNVAPRIGKKYLTWKEDYTSQNGVDLIKDSGLRLMEIMEKGKFPEHMEAKKFPAFIGGVYRNIGLEQKRKGGKLYEQSLSLDFKKDEDHDSMIDSVRSNYESAEEKMIREYVMDSSLKIMDGVAKKLKSANPEKAKKIWWMLKAEFKDPTKIAKEVGVSAQTVYNIKEQGEKLAWIEAKRIKFNPQEYFKAKGYSEKEINALNEFLKAKRREIGEVYTQPSGRLVKKIAKNKVVEVKQGKETKEPEETKDDQSSKKDEPTSPKTKVKKSFVDLMKDLVQKRKDSKSKEEYQESTKRPIAKFSKMITDMLFDSIKGTASQKVGENIQETGKELQSDKKKEKEKENKKKPKEEVMKAKELNALNLYIKSKHLQN